MLCSQAVRSSIVVLLPVVDVRVSVTFHLVCVHVIFCSVWVAEWPSFGNELLTRLTMCYIKMYFDYMYFSYFPFWL